MVCHDTPCIYTMVLLRTKNVQGEGTEQITDRYARWRKLETDCNKCNACCARLLWIENVLPVLFKAGALGKTLFSAIAHTHVYGCTRCTAPSRDLDGHQHLRQSCTHTEMLGEEFELGVLWDEYGIVGDVIVNFPYNYISITTYFFTFLAIYKCFSTSRYSWASLTWYTSLIDKGNIQGQHSYLGYWLHQGNTFWTWS